MQQKCLRGRFYYKLFFKKNILNPQFNGKPRAGTEAHPQNLKFKNEAQSQHSDYQ